jgi:hypothetical protein
MHNCSSGGSSSSSYCHSTPHNSSKCDGTDTAGRHSQQGQGIWLRGSAVNTAKWWSVCCGGWQQQRCRLGAAV